MKTLLDSKPQKEFLKKLLAWYKKNGRHDMPWRKSKDPYAVLLSEFMLQQTTVATVRPYYDRFLKKFPTLKSLAKADLNAVLALWSGLGYYARARNLWSTARVIQEKCKGRIPGTLSELERLPGIGAYTAGAVMAFGFNKPAAVLDANIIRLLMRLLAIEDDPKLRAAQILLKKVALDLSAGSSAGSKQVNLALMDLGSTVCLPQTPKCVECPVSKFCLARLNGREEFIPLKGEAPEKQIIRRLYAAIVHEGRWLMGQRPEEGLFGGLWEFLGVDAPHGSEPVLHLEEAVTNEIGFKIRVNQAMPPFEHQLTHRTFIVRPFVCAPFQTTGPDLLPEKGKAYKKFRWVSPSKVSQLGVSSVTKRIIADLSQLSRPTQ